VVRLALQDRVQTFDEAEDMNTKHERELLTTLVDLVRTMDPEKRVNWMASVLPDYMSAEELEDLGNRLGRAAHMKDRSRGDV